MTELEKKLLEYRAKKQLTDNDKHFPLFEEGKDEVEEDPEDPNTRLLPSPEPLHTAPKPTTPVITVIYYATSILLWLTLYALFIQLQFGTVFLIVSALVGIYLNTRTGPKKKGEISAYSVFNENCESIDGTLKAEQFEREIRYGPAGVR